MTHHFDKPVSLYMSRNLETAPPTADLHELLARIEVRRLSSIPIVNPAGAPLGLVTRTDLVRLGVKNIALRGTTPSLPLPKRTAGEVMTSSLLITTPERTLREAARDMVRHSAHRLLVVADHVLVGVISTLDLANAVHDARIASPISAWMTSPVVAVEANQPVAAAVDLLDRLHISAVAVLEDGEPIGIFSQLEALLARDVPRDTPVEALLDAAMICLPATYRISRAAAHASQLDVRRILATRGRELVGIVGGLDFARVVADA